MTDSTQPPKPPPEPPVPPPAVPPRPDPPPPPPWQRFTDAELEFIYGKPPAQP